MTCGLWLLQVCLPARAPFIFCRKHTFESMCYNAKLSHSTIFLWNYEGGNAYNVCGIFRLDFLVYIAFSLVCFLICGGKMIHKIHSCVLLCQQYNQIFKSQVIKGLYGSLNGLMTYLLSKKLKSSDKWMTVYCQSLKQLEETRNTKKEQHFLPNYFEVRLCLLTLKK